MVTSRSPSTSRLSSPQQSTTTATERPTPAHDGPRNRLTRSCAPDEPDAWPGSSGVDQRPAGWREVNRRRGLETRASDAPRDEVGLLMPEMAPNRPPFPLLVRFAAILVR